MTVGKIYYLATILNNLSIAAWVILCGSITYFIVSMLICFSEYYLDDGVEKLKKYVKIPFISVVISLIIIIFTPSKEDFLIIAMTKDYKPEQIYKMTKDEIKNSIDYLFKQIKEIKEWWKKNIIFERFERF